MAKHLLQLASAAILLGAFACGPGNTSELSNVTGPAINFPNGQIVELKARHSSKCVDVSGASTANAAAVQQYACNGTNAQKFRLQVDGASYKIVNVNSGKCLDVKNFSNADGGQIHQWTCANVAHQRAKFYASTNGSFKVRFDHSLKCLDVAGVSTADGTLMQQWSCVNTPNQDFFVVAQNAVAPQTPSPSPTAKLPIRVQGRQLLVDGKPFTIRGVCYAPVPKGKDINGTLFLNPTANDLLTIEKDFRMMQEAGLNTIRPYMPITNSKVLELLNKYQLFVIQPLFNHHLTSNADIQNVINTVKTHRSTLMWQIGNEWNYNLLYGAANFDTAKRLVKERGAFIKSLDRTIPLSTNWGEMVDPNLVNELTDFDIWSLNVYAGKTFGNRFNDYKNRSTKPMFLGEFGADAFNQNINATDPNAQGEATDALVREIKANLSAVNATNAALGGTIFEWNDEWWKDPKGTLNTQDRGGIAPGGGPFPDSVFNEEWWGVVDIDRNPRPAYLKLRDAWK